MCTVHLSIVFIFKSQFFFSRSRVVKAKLDPTLRMDVMSLHILCYRARLKQRSLLSVRRKIRVRLQKDEVRAWRDALCIITSRVHFQCGMKSEDLSDLEE